MEIAGYTYIYKHNIKIGSMVRTEHICLILKQFRFSFDFIEYENRPNYAVSPYLLDSEHQTEPFPAPEQNIENREKDEKSDNRIDKKEGTPDPLKWIEKVFAGFFEHF